MPGYVRLLGSPAIQHEKEWFYPPISLSLAMLYYLAYKGSWVPREELSFLFWADLPEANARKNLRNLLQRTKALSYVQDLEIQRHRICWHVETDAERFRQALASNELEKALEHYSGDFLQGIHLDDALEFREWKEVERQALNEKWRDAIFSLVQACEIKEKHARAATLLAQLGKADPLDEDIIQRQLKHLHLSGQKTKALSLYESFKAKLELDFDGEPDRVTLELVQTIRNSEVSAASISPSLQTKRDRSPGYRLPAQATAFIGREVEIKRLSEQLSDPDCRLVTIVSPGGMGKTRLALTVGKQQLDTFKGDVFFVSFVSTATPDNMLYTLAAALGFNFYGQHEPEEELLSYLSKKRMLLILDNLEHLLEGVGLIAKILEGAPQIRILATSRERLNLRAEWLFDLVGLSTPDSEFAINVSDYDAIKLFLQSARKVQSDFTFGDDVTVNIVKICQLVAGMPLAIELAVNWLRIMPLEDVVKELEKGIDLLKASTRDIPERHRSIRAVFEYSWKLLSEKEQEAMKKLTVFKGGFDRKAASEVTDVQLFELSLLVDKSFLNLTQDGRYRRHPLVIQFAEEKVQAELDEISELSEKHAWYYLRFLQTHARDLRTLKRPRALELLEKDIQNIRLAWFWMLETLNLEAIKNSTFALTDFFEDRLVECADLLTRTMLRLDETNPAHHAALGYVLVSLVDLEISRVAFGDLPALSQKALALLRPSGDVDGFIRALYAMSLMNWAKGQFSSSQQYALEGLQLAKKHNSHWDTSKLYRALTFAERELSPFSRVSQLYQEGIIDAQTRGDYTGLSILRQQYGVYLVQHNHLPEGEALLQEALKLSESLDYRIMQIFIFDDMAYAALRAADYDRVEALSYKVLSLSKDAQTISTYGQLKALTRLARVAVSRRDYLTAQKHLKKSLALAWETNSIFGTLAGLAYFAEWYMAQGQFAKASYYLKIVNQHPALANELKFDVDVFLRQLPRELLQPDLDTQDKLELEIIVKNLLAEM